MHIWEFREATKGSGQYDCHDITRSDVQKEHFSSLAKCRKEVKKRMEKKYGSPNCFHQEDWIKEDEECIVFNLGGNSIFAYRRIEVK